MKKVAMGLGLLLAGCQSGESGVSAPSLQPPVVQNASRPASIYRPAQSASPWMPSAARHQWKWIVIHHSDTKTGSAGSFDRHHREVNGWEGLGYHFVIGNGTGSGDGEVEVGFRWRQQKTGAHAGVRKYNEDGIGICLVGDFETGRPTNAQLHALARLAGHLMKQHGIPASHIIGHQDVGRGTKCPGRHLNLAVVRAMALRAK